MKQSEVAESGITRLTKFISMHKNFNIFLNMREPRLADQHAAFSQLGWKDIFE